MNALKRAIPDSNLKHTNISTIVIIKNIRTMTNSIVVDSEWKI